MSDDLVRHPEAVELAARGYLDQLSAVGRETNPDGRLGSAVTRLMRTLEAALERRSDLTPDEIPFTRADLVGLEDWQQLAVLDQQSLGVGNDGAQVIFMGTEEAYGAGDGGDLAIGCGLSALWLCGSRRDVLQRIDPTVTSRSVDPRAYHRHPNDFYRVDLDRGRSTWKCLAELLRPGDANSLLVWPGDSQGPSLGDLCYQIEVSAYPSSLASGGRAAGERRVGFLRQFLPLLVEAKALVFHGGDEGPRTQLAQAFLGTDDVRWETHDVPREWLRQAVHGDRIVLHTYALNGRVRSSYLDMVRRRLAGFLPG
jgi:hypothetical protein